MERTAGIYEMSNTNDVCDVEPLEQFNYPKWTSWDFFRWRVTPEWMGGGEAYLYEYKDNYIRFHRFRIKAYAAHYQIPSSLLAGVAWAEAGGKPDSVKESVFLGRAFDWMGPDWVDQHLTITNPPEKTSFGIIAMQVGVAADELGRARSLSIGTQMDIYQCLMMDAFNIDIVARHLRNLILYDYPDIKATQLSDEQMILAASRYNRGIERNKQDFLASIAAPPVADRAADPEGYQLRDYTSYGRRLLERRPHVQKLLEEPQLPFEPGVGLPPK